MKLLLLTTIGLALYNKDISAIDISLPFRPRYIETKFLSSGDNNSKASC